MFKKVIKKIDKLKKEMDKALSDEVTLADEVENLTKDKREIKRLLENLESEKPTMEKDTFERLKDKYEQRKKEIETQYDLKKGKLGAEIKRLEEEKEDIALKIKVMKKDLDELKTRYKIGEIETKEYDEHREELLRKGDQYLKDKEAVERLISRYEALVKS